MSIEKVRAYFEHFGIADRIREFDVSSATVELAAVAVGVEGARIAKSMSFKRGRCAHHHRDGGGQEDRQRQVQGVFPRESKDADL